MIATDKIWMNGELVDWGDAKVHVGAHGLHYGTGVFEGIRCYETPSGPAVFRLTDHIKRLDASAKLLYMELPYSVEEIRDACLQLIGVNGLPECYLRPFAFYGYGELGVSTAGNPVEVVIMSWPWGAYLGDEGMKNGIRCKISSWKRVGANTIPHAAKATGIYLNSMLAVIEANRAGYDEAILLTDDGYIADGSGENVFVVKDGKITTPPLSTSILPGITRNSIIQIAQDLGYTVEETQLDPYRPLPRGRDLHDRDRRGGDADPLGGRPGGRTARRGHAQAAEGLPRHGARRERALVALARVRLDPFSGTHSGAGVTQATRRVPLARPWIDEREEELVLEVLRSGRLSLGPTIDRFEELIAERVGAPYAAAVSSGTAGLHMLVRAAGIGEGDEVITSTLSFAASGELFPLRGRDAGLRRRRPAHVESRPGRRGGGDHRADEGNRRRRHVRLPVRARGADGDRRAPWARADRGLGRGARGRVQGEADRVARSARGVRLLSEQAGCDR